MASSTRRLIRTPSRRSNQMDLAELVQAFLDHHWALRHSQHTIDHYADSLRLLQRCLSESGLPPTTDSMTNQTMIAFAAWLRITPVRPWRGKTERSVWGVHGALVDTKAFVRWAEAQGYLDRAPKVPIPRLPQRLFPILSEDDLDAVFASKHLADRTEVATRNRALVAFMLDTGVRLSEAAGLLVEDLDVKNNAARIRGKGNKERLVYYSNGVAEALRRWLAVGGHSEGSLFWLTVSGLRMVFKRIQVETGLKVFTPHQLRHTALTMLVKQNVDLHTIKRLAGHASVTTTEAYLALAGEDIRAKHALASPFDQMANRHRPAAEGRRRLRAS